MRKDPARETRRRFVGWAAAIALIFAGAGRENVAFADEAASVQALSDAVAVSGDFRVRANAALLLGRHRSPVALDALERALSDRHPSVRAAAAQALGVLADPSAAGFLERRAEGEPSLSVKAQIRVTLAALRSSGPSSLDATPAPSFEVRYLVALGSMRNGAGVRGEDLGRVLATSARQHTVAMRGASPADRDAARTVRTHAPLAGRPARRVPVITLDGRVVQLSESRSDGRVCIRAAVEFAVRRNQDLRGTLSGTATATRAASALTDEVRRQMQDDAVDGAVQSALRGAEQGLVVAAR